MVAISSPKRVIRVYVANIGNLNSSESATKGTFVSPFLMKNKILLVICLLLSLGITTMIFFSKYGMHPGISYPCIREYITIKAPADSLFRFLGNSENARKWSVFVDHITTTNSDSIADGMPGSIRIAYCNEDETGMSWEEKTTRVVPNQLRQLITYNYKEFLMTAEGLATEQIYEVIDSNTTKLTFTLFYLNHEPSYWELLKTHFSSYRASNIFAQNLNNIKRIVETGK